MSTNVCAIAATLALTLSRAAFAWGPEGHQTVAQLAEHLIQGAHAATQVRTILGTVTLSDAAVWADCAKGVNEKHNFTYEGAGTFPECGVFETTAGEKAMVNYVRRNANSCVIKPDAEICHKQYHYSDVDIQQGRYAPDLFDARDDDVVHAIGAAVAVLEGQPSPAPFHIQGQREALMLLVHFMGDVHQPLHVGAIYLNAAGKPVHPTKATFNATTSTRGGNQLMLDGENLHHHWDAMPQGLSIDQAVSTLLSEAQATPLTSGAAKSWPTDWASQSVVQARQAFNGVTFGAVSHEKWAVTLPANYEARMDAIKKGQLAAAGAHLAQVLKSIWP